MSKMKWLSVCLLSGALLAGCGESTEETDSEGCEHLQQGPGVAVTASSTASGAPAVSNDHKRYDIALPSSGTGSVSFAASEATDYVFYLNADVPLAITTGSGQSVAFEASAKSSTSCTDIRGRHVAPLSVGTHTLTFGPGSGTVSLVIEESDHDHAH